MPAKRQIRRIANITYIVDPPPKGYVYPCEVQDIREKLETIKPEMLRNVAVIHLCNQVKMNPGVDAHIIENSVIRIYPVPEKLRWRYGRRKPNPAECQERIEFGAYWQKIDDQWFLRWDRDSLKQYFLDHILLHEIGHSLDDLYVGTHKGEKYAEAFAHRVGKNHEIKRKAKKRRKRLRRHFR